MSQQNKRLGTPFRHKLTTIQLNIIIGMVGLVLFVAGILFISPNISEILRAGLILLGVLGCLYLGFYYYFYFRSPNKNLFGWINSSFLGIAIGMTAFFIPPQFDFLSYSLIFVGAMFTSVSSPRAMSYLFLLLASFFQVFSHIQDNWTQTEWIMDLGFTIAALAAIEIIQRFKTISDRQIKRLEVVNELSKQIISTLDRNQILTLLNAVFQSAVDADTYYLGILEEDKIQMKLFYDDGEYFNNLKVDKKGTLSGWVMDNQQELFLPDLRQNVQLEGVDFVLIGKSKGSLSWLGVPVRTTHLNGVMAIGSYRPNAFNQSDLELLNNIAQRAALALDNAHHHEIVQAEARLDSLTRVYNHGYFISTLSEMARQCNRDKQPLSLIMLDIDYFKKYNDSYGHQMGDEVLVNLCNFIRENVKTTDAVGRWGGEEFAIALPGADGNQALEVAKRIQKSMETFTLRVSEQKTIPVPTVSQGIAIFPNDTGNVSKLIDIADKRLYKAKERGRNQIEPGTLES